MSVMLMGDMVRVAAFMKAGVLVMCGILRLNEINLHFSLHYV